MGAGAVVDGLTLQRGSTSAHDLHQRRREAEMALDAHDSYTFFRALASGKHYDLMTNKEEREITKAPSDEVSKVNNRRSFETDAVEDVEVPTLSASSPLIITGPTGTNVMDLIVI